MDLANGVSPMKGERRQHACVTATKTLTPSLSRACVAVSPGNTRRANGHGHGVAGGVESNILVLVRQQAEEIRKLRKELLNVTNERDALLCEVHHLKMDILASELGRIGSCSSTSVGDGEDNDLNLDENENSDGEDAVDECYTKKNGGVASLGPGVGPRAGGVGRLGKFHVNNNNNENPRPKLLHSKAFAISEENGQDDQLNGFRHFREPNMDDGKASISSSSEMTRLSTSSSSSSASSSPVLFTSSQSSSSQFHDSTEETGESGLVERTYGGQPARNAALVIQRAFRRYSMVKEFQRIKTERRLSRRINNNVPTAAAHSGGPANGGLNNGCEVCVELCHLSSSDDDRQLHHSHTLCDANGGDDDEENSSVHSGELSRSPCPDVTEVEIEIDQQHLPPHLRTSTVTSNTPMSPSSSMARGGLDASPDSSQKASLTSSRKQLNSSNDQNGSSPSAAIATNTSSSRVHNSQYEPCSRYIPATTSTVNIQYQQPPPRQYVDYQYQHPYAVTNHHNHQHQYGNGHPPMIYNNHVHHCVNNTSSVNLQQQQQCTKVSVSPNNGVAPQQPPQHVHHQCANGVGRNSTGAPAQHHSIVSQTQSANVPTILPINNGNYRLPMTDVECEILRKRLYRVGLNLFNKKPEVGISYLVKKKFIEGTASAVSRFLISRKGLSKQMIGEYLANLQNPFCQSCLEHFSNEIDLSKMPIDLALRRFQTFLRMPGEAQKIERVMETFSQRYGVCNPQITSQFRNGPDTVFVLAFAIIMLNTDLHTPHLKADRRMKLEDFIRNLRGIDDSADVPRQMLVEIYDRIKQNEFRTGSDHVTQVMKVQQTIVGKKPNLALPHRRLVCYCRLYEVADTNKREKVGAHQREVFLFNDILVLTKIFHKKRNSVTYSFRQSYPLTGISLMLFTNQYYEFGLSLRRGDTVLLNLNARNEHDRAKFAEDLREAIAESDEMARMESLSKENRDSGVDVGKMKRFSNSLLDINDQCKPTRRGSCGSLDSGMSISFHSDENQQSQQSQQNSSNNNSSRSSSSIHHKHQNSSCSNSSTSTTQSK